MFRLLISVSILLFAITGCKNNSSEKKVNTKDSFHQSGYAPIHGLNMYYEIHGEGTPLILIHGGGSTIQTTFGKILPMLAENFRVIAVELQAHGHTRDRDTAETFEQDADDVTALVQYLKIDTAHILGFSNGGNTAMQVAIRHPGMVNKLVIISAFYKREGLIMGFFESMENATLENMPKYLMEAFLEINNDSTALQRMFERDKARMLQFKDWSDEVLSSIKVPTLLMQSDKDVVTKEHGIEMSNKIPNSELLILPGTHGSIIGEGISAKQKSNIPALAVEVITEFLNK